jgi:hypothetical protein
MTGRREKRCPSRAGQSEFKVPPRDLASARIQRLATSRLAPQVLGEPKIVESAWTTDLKAFERGLTRRAAVDQDQACKQRRAIEAHFAVHQHAFPVAE